MFVRRAWALARSWEAFFHLAMVLVDVGLVSLEAWRCLACIVFELGLCRESGFLSVFCYVIWMVGCCDEEVRLLYAERSFYTSTQMATNELLTRCRILLFASHQYGVLQGFLGPVKLARCLEIS